MYPENGRPMLENLDDARIAEEGIMLARRMHKGNETTAVHLADRAEDLPIHLSNNYTKEVVKGLKEAVRYHAILSHLTETVATEWLAQLTPKPPAPIPIERGKELQVRHHSARVNSSAA